MFHRTSYEHPVGFPAGNPIPWPPERMARKRKEGHSRERGCISGSRSHLTFNASVFQRRRYGDNGQSTARYKGEVDRGHI